MVYESTWWSAELPADWSASSDEVCASLAGPNSAGSLQISAARKLASPIANDELREFAAGEEIPVQVHCGHLSGYFVEDTRDGRLWKKWWLAQHSTVLFITYNVARDDASPEELGLVEGIIRSLRIRAS